MNAVSGQGYTPLLLAVSLNLEDITLALASLILQYCLVNLDGPKVLGDHATCTFCVGHYDISDDIIKWILKIPKIIPQQLLS